MKSTAVVTIRFVSIFIVMYIVSCTHRQEQSSEEIPALYSNPATFIVNTNGGYKTNLVTGDSIAPLINSFGDTVRTGTPILIRPIAVDPEIISRPKVAPISVTSNVQAYPNKHPIREPHVIEIDSTQVKKYRIGIDTLSTILINSIGDTIPTGVPTVLKGKVVRCLQSSPVATLPPRMKENSLYDIQYMSEDEGLNTPSPTRLFEDSKGNLWIGGANGVGRYNGVSLRYYTTNEGLCDNIVESIVEDKHGHLWFGTRGGICRFDGLNFIHYTENEGIGHSIIFSVLEEREEGFFWIATFGAGICKFTPSLDGRTAEIIHYTTREGLSNNRVTSIEKDTDGKLWCGTAGGGVNLFDPPNTSHAGSFTHYNTRTGLLNDWVMSVCKDYNNNLWFATFGGATQYIRTSNSAPPMFRHFTKAHGLSDNMTWSVLEDSDHDIWICTYTGGLNKINSGARLAGYSESITVYNEDIGLTHNYVWSVYEDQSRNLWLGTVGGGIMQFNKRSFEHYSKKEGLCGNDIQSFLEDHQGNIWIGDNGSGFSCYQPERDGRPASFTNYRIDSLYSGGNTRNRIHAMLQDKKGNIWFASKGGVYQFRIASDGTPTECIFYQLRLPRNAILYSSCLEDHTGSLWFGSDGGGITRYIPSDSVTGMFFQYTEKEGLASNAVSAIQEDENQNIWISSRGGGISRYIPALNSNEGTIIHYTDKEGLPSNEINCMYLENIDKIWFGTSGEGVFQLHTDSSSDSIHITVLSEAEGLSNNSIWSITADPNQSNWLWVGTSRGLSIIQLNAENYKITELGKQDGLKRTDFDINTVLFDSQENIWWGTGNGIEVLNSTNLILSDKIPAPRLSGLDINGTFVDYGNLADSTKRGIEFDSLVRFENYPHHPTFSPKNNHLTFHYSAIDWAAPHKIRYSHLMSGLDEAWSSPTKENKIDYRNLPPGTFTFKIRAIGESQTWSEPFQYAFTIRPPWYLSMWAYLFYLITGGACIYALHRFQLNRKLEKEEKKRLLELDTVKNRLYTNITHEFRTPLTLIHGPVSMALSSHTPLDENDLKGIHRQSGRLQQLITQMLDLQKIEAGKMKPNFIYGDIVQRFRYILSLFDSWAKDKGISLDFFSTPDEILMDYDEEKLTQIVSNLISNAIKHTARNGNVSVTLSTPRAGKMLELRVHDTGSGIGPEDLPFIFDRYYQSPRAAAGGTGIGLSLTKTLVELLGGSVKVDSTLNVGTTFTIHLPITAVATQSAKDQKGAVLIPHHYDEELKFLPPLASASDKPIVLIVEDHPDVAQFVASCLKKDFSTMIAADGDEGIKQALEHIPDLVVSDVMMPGKDGFELCATLKKDIQTSHIPVILLTGRGDQAALMEGIEHGADAYVVKPFEPQELILRANKLLELRAKLSEYYRTQTEKVRLSAPAETSARENAFLQNIRTFVEEHMSDSQFNMHMLCQHMAMSHPQLHRKITALTGESTGKFVRSVRLMKAIELLKNSDLTVSEIAYETGFSEPGYFTKVFSREYNITPTEYRMRQA